MTSPERLIRTLSEALQADEQLHAYILVDPMLREPFPAGMPEEARCPQAQVPVTRLEHDPTQRPRLIAWRPAAAHLLDASVRAALDEQADPLLEATHGFAIGGWLLASAPLDALTLHFRQVMQLFRPGTGSRYFRWFDRRVLEWMWDGLSVAQQRQLMGPATVWWSVDRRGELVKRTAPSDSKSPPCVPPLTLTAEQWTRADQGEAVHAMVRGWQQFSPELPADYLHQAAHVVAGAQSLGVARQADAQLLGAYILQVHPRLCEHPTIAKTVARAQREGVALSQALAEIPDPDGWDAIARELDESSPAQAAG